MLRESFSNPVSFGSESYSKEELIAEMTAAMLCGVAGIDQKILVNSAAYLKTWITRLKSDAKLLVSAASHAQRAADFIQANPAVPSRTGHVPLDPRAKGLSTPEGALAINEWLFELATAAVESSNPKPASIA